jgi:hypothetical protein
MSALLTSPPNPVPIGLKEAIEAAGHSITAEPAGWAVDDAVAVQAIINSYAGSAAELQWHKKQKQIALDQLFDAHFDLTKFIRDGTATSITATNVGTFLAQITNNYRSLRANIAAAATVAVVDAINVNLGWPSNP